MSTDYSRGAPVISGVFTAPTNNQILGYYFSKSFSYAVLHVEALVLVAATDADNTIRLEMGVTGGVFTSTTTLADINYTTGAAGTSFETRVDADDVIIEAGFAVRLKHVNADASASLWYSVAATPVHE